MRSIRYLVLVVAAAGFTTAAAIAAEPATPEGPGQAPAANTQSCVTTTNISAMTQEELEKHYLKYLP